MCLCAGPSRPFIRNLSWENFRTNTSMMIKFKTTMTIMMIANIMTAMLLASEMDVRILIIYAHT